MDSARAGGALLLAVVAAGCATSVSASAAPDASGGADTTDAADVARGDPASDAEVAVDAACNPCWYGHCIDRAVCVAATAIEPGVPLTMQNTGSGGYGDCATFGSSGGDPQLYYSLLIPPGGQFPRHVRVTAAPVDPGEAAYLRVLSSCDATAVESGARGGAATNGAATACASNGTPGPRTVIIAVGNYSNAAGGLAFDLAAAELVDPDLGCSF